MMDGNLHHRTPNLIGQTFGALTALNPEHSNGCKRYWRFRCACGEQCVKVGTEVRKAAKRGGTPNCGCLTSRLNREARITHGMSKHPAYAVYRSMIDRCRLSTHQAWANYGGRGIKVCARWRGGFDNFWVDMGPTYQRGLDLDRINNDGPYSPQNCRWATRRTNTMNKRNTERRVDVVALSKATGISPTTLYYRLAHGWPVDQLTRPPSPTNRCTTSSTADPATDS